MTLPINKSVLSSIASTEKLIIFTGSGTSMNLGLPNWQQLVVDICKEISAFDNSVEPFIQLLQSQTLTPLQVLNHLEKHKSHIYKTLCDKLTLSKERDYSLQKLLYSLSPKIITTNYDKAFEFSTNEQLNVIIDSKYKLSTLSKEKSFLFKIHGDVDEIDQCILFESQYHEFYEENESAKLFELKKAFTDYTILFVGFSMTDPYIVQLLKHLSNLYDANITKHYIITTDVSFKSSDLCKLIEPITLSNYNELYPVIEELIQLKTNRSPQTVKALPSTSPKPLSHISILQPNPIDKPFNLNTSYLTEALLKYALHINHGFLNTLNLNNLSQEQLLIVFTKFRKGKMLTEDEYLMSKYIDLTEFEENIALNSLSTIVIFYEGDLLEFNFQNLERSYILIRCDESNVKELSNKFIYYYFNKKALHNGEIFQLRGLPLQVISSQKGLGLLSKYVFKSTNYLDLKSLSRFIGRRTDLETLVRKLSDLKYKNRLINIKGSGGIGKTTIILKAGYELGLRGFYPAGVHFIPCQSIISFQNLTYVISQCFDLNSTSQIRNQIADNFTTKQQLIIFDNFETLLHISEVNEVIQLIGFLTDYASVVLTSRETTHLDYEDIFELRNFTTDEGVELFKSIYPYVKEEDEKLLRFDIVEKLLNSNPLAIKLIAKGLPYQKDLRILRDELEDDIFANVLSVDIFERPEDMNIEKSRSLYHSINYSYQQLSEKEKFAFEILSLFPDGIHLENLKKSIKNSNRKDTTITDREIRSLGDKSLLENSNNILRLQSIISRFAEHQFNKRTIEVQKEFSTLAFRYNKFLAKLILNRNTIKQGQAMVLMDLNSNNFAKMLSLVENIAVLPYDFIDFFDDVGHFFAHSNQLELFLKHLTKIKQNFRSDQKLSNAILAIELYAKYWTTEFEQTYSDLQTLIPLDYLFSLNPNDKLENCIIRNAIGIYECEGFQYEIITHSLTHQLLVGRVDHDLFNLGYLNESLRIVEKDIEHDVFIPLQVRSTLGLVNEDQFNEAIQSIFNKESLEITQSTYIKWKHFEVEESEIKKLVITNPYTHGLVKLMQTKFIEDTDAKLLHFEEALELLKHIKYYYLEANLFKVSYLKEIGHNDFEHHYKTGLKMAKDLHFSYLVFQYENLIEPNLVYDQRIYTEKYAPLVHSDDLNLVISQYINSKI